MPFGQPFDRYYKNVFVPAIADAGLKAIRADDIFAPTPIVSDIWRLTQSADVLLADVTGKNANVFYELGLAHASQKPVIIVTGDLADVPFDLKGLRILVYDKNHEDWGEQLRKNITQALVETMADPLQAVPNMFLKVDSPTAALVADPVISVLNQLTQEIRALRTVDEQQNQNAMGPTGRSPELVIPRLSEEDGTRLKIRFEVSEVLERLGASDWPRKVEFGDNGEVYIRIVTPRHKALTCRVDANERLSKSRLKERLSKLIAESQGKAARRQAFTENGDGGDHHHDFRSDLSACMAVYSHAKTANMVMLHSTRLCRVSYIDSDGLRHSVEVNAASLYEAAVLACKTFQEHECPPAPMHEIRVEVTSSVVHTLTQKKLDAWLDADCRSPKERVTKDRLKALLCDSAV